MSFLTAPLARLAALIEGAYPLADVPGRRVTAGRHKAARLHGDLRDAEYPAVHFHRAYNLAIDTSGDVPGQPANMHAGSRRKVVVVRLDLGYLTGRDAPSLAAGAGGALLDPTVLAHSDHDELEEALRYPGFWPGTTPVIAGLSPAGDVEPPIVTAASRIVVSRLWRMTLNIVPGTAHT